MIIQIDNREKHLIKILPSLLKMYDFDKQNTIMIENIPLGDIVLYKTEEDIKNDNPIVIIERKSLTDLASSIRDGRYNEQSLRLHHTNTHNHNIWYIIEGNVKYYSSKYTKVEPKALYSAMVSLNYYKGFTIFRTFDVVETAEFIIRSVDKIHREKKLQPFYQNNESENYKKTTFLDVHENKSGEKSILKDNIDEVINNKEPVSQFEQQQYKNDIPYSNTVKKVKKENLTPENIGEVILSQIPGISNITSLAVMKHYGSLYNLIIELGKDPKCLETFKYKTSNGQIRKISSSSIQNIINYLLYQKDNVISIT
jgi:ERCC4-type nuclease